MRGFLLYLLERLVPPVCISCGLSLDGGPRTVAALPDGWPPETLAFLSSGPGTGREGAAARVLCDRCLFRLRPARRPGTSVVSPFRINADLLEMVRFLKFSGGRAAVSMLGWWMANAIAPRAGGRAILVNVPLHPRRLRERGYDQAALLAAAVGDILRLPVGCGVLRRARCTRGQSLLDRAEREGNVRGAFSLDRPAAVTGKDVILVDDLVTSGATARACLAAVERGAPRTTTVLAAGRAAGID